MGRSAYGRRLPEQLTAYGEQQTRHFWGFNLFTSFIILVYRSLQTTLLLTVLYKPKRSVNIITPAVQMIASIRERCWQLAQAYCASFHYYQMTGFYLEVKVRPVTVFLTVSPAASVLALLSTFKNSVTLARIRVCMYTLEHLM